MGGVGLRCHQGGTPRGPPSTFGPYPRFAQTSSTNFRGCQQRGYFNLIDYCYSIIFFGECQLSSCVFLVHSLHAVFEQLNGYSFKKNAKLDIKFIILGVAQLAECQYLKLVVQGSIPCP